MERALWLDRCIGSQRELSVQKQVLTTKSRDFRLRKKASETIGTLVEAGGGTFQQEFGMAQYGGELGKATDFRVYTKYFNQNHMLDPNGQNGADGWHRLREGFRTDSRLSPKDSLME